MAERSVSGGDPNRKREEIPMVWDYYDRLRSSPTDRTPIREAYSSSGVTTCCELHMEMLQSTTMSIWLRMV